MMPTKTGFRNFNNHRFVVRKRVLQKWTNQSWLAFNFGVTLFLRVGGTRFFLFSKSGDAPRTIYIVIGGGAKKFGPTQESRKFSDMFLLDSVFSGRHSR